MHQQIQRGGSAEAVIDGEAEPLGTAHHSFLAADRQHPDGKRRDVRGRLPRANDIKFLGVLECENADGQRRILAGGLTHFLIA